MIKKILKIFGIIIGVSAISIGLYFGYFYLLHYKTMAFMYPLFEEDRVAIDYLIDEKGYDANNLPDGYNLLHIYISGQGDEPNLEFIEYLLKKGIDPNKCEGTKTCAIHSAILWNRADVVSLLIKYGADVNKKVNGEFTPIGIALNTKKCEIAKLLFENEADLIGDFNELNKRKTLEECYK